MNEWIPVTEAARIAGCSGTTVRGRMSVKSGTARRHPTPGGRGFRWQVRRSWAQELVVGKSESKARKRIDQAIVSRDKWRAESTRQKNQIEGLKTRIERMEADRNQWKALAEARLSSVLEQEAEIGALRAAAAGAPDRASDVIDRLVAAVDADPLRATTEIDAPRHAALRRIVGMWTAIKHALKQFQPGDTAQTTNDDDEVI